MNTKITAAFLLTLLIASLTACNQEENEKTVESSSLSVQESQAATSEISTGIEESGYDYPVAFMVDKGENYFDYQPGYECAAFSSAYVLRHYGEEADALTLFEDFPAKLSSGDGVYPNGITQFFENRGYDINYVTDATVEDIKQEISSKNAPVIVFIHVNPPVESVHYTHYIPIVGYDEENFYFAESLKDKANCKEEEGLAYNRKTEIEAFRILWQNIDGVWNYPYYSISIKE